jgi:cephalosporin hydroxylase
MKTFHEYVSEYHNTEKDNNCLWQEFTELIDEVPYLKEHRDWVEKYQWGFGDRAFHYMWHLILTQDILKRSNPALLEIGVYKGQVISLWSLIAAKVEKIPTIYAISPLLGKKILPRYFNRLMQLLKNKYREDVKVGNFYQNEDYLNSIKLIYEQFDLNITSVNIIKGYSQDSLVKTKIVNLEFDLIYVDGGHRYKEVSDDIAFYGKIVKLGGYIVFDDASFYLPGSIFFKGYESVSKAVEELNTNKFVNILNVGHNRIFKRII